MKRSIEIVERDFSFLKKEWPTLRVAWGLLALFVLAGLLGFFGGGILSDRKIDTSLGRIEYERFLRHSTASRVVIESGQPLSDSSIYINRSYLKQVRIDQIAPRPVSTELIGEKIRFKFATQSSGPIILHIIPYQGSGAQILEVGWGGKNEVLNQFIYF